MATRWTVRHGLMPLWFTDLVGGVNVPSLQTKALEVTPIGGDDFRLITPNCVVSQACVLR